MRTCLFLLFLCSCGYRLGDSSIVNRYHTINVPFVQGDRDGRLTEAIVKEVALSSPLSYCSSGARLCLQAKIVDCGQENIGYQYDENRQGKRTDRTVANESRLIYAVEFSVIDTLSGCRVLGPICIKDDMAYDFDPLGNENGLAIFSIGQYVIFDQAGEEAKKPLYERLSRQIVAYLNAAW